MKLRYLAPIAALGMIVAPAAAMAAKAPKTHAAKTNAAKTKPAAKSKKGSKSEDTSPKTN